MDSDLFSPCNKLSAGAATLLLYRMDYLLISTRFVAAAVVMNTKAEVGHQVMAKLRKSYVDSTISLQ